MRTWDVFKLENVELLNGGMVRWMRTWDVFKFVKANNFTASKFDEWEHEMYLNPTQKYDKDNPDGMNENMRCI